MLSLISLSLQDSHCLVSLEYCEEEEENSKDPVKIEHCYEMKGDKCDDCLIGYAASYEGTSCLPFQNCNSLEEGNKNCAECYYGFKVNSNGQCERTLCNEYDDEGKKCTKCFKGYYLKDNQCQKIAIENCIELDTKDQNKCAKCIEVLAEPVDGKCIAPTTWVKGCSNYDETGKCVECYSEFKPNGDKCDPLTCPTGEKKLEYCLSCEAGFYTDNDDICVGYDGTKDATATDFVKGIKVKYAWIALLLAILI